MQLHPFLFTMKLMVLAQTYQQFSVTELKGVGSQLAIRLQTLGINSVQDLLFHLPFRYQDRTRINPIGSLRPGDHAVIEGTIELADISFGRRRSLLVYLSDGTGHITLRFFYFNAVQQRNLSQRSARIRCYGEVRLGKAGLEMIHPEYRFCHEPLPIEESLTPIYPATEGLQQLSLRKLTAEALQFLQKNPELLEEYLPEKILQQFHLPNLQQALQYVHRPPANADQKLLEAGLHPAQQRLAFEELLSQQLSLIFLRQQTKQQLAPAFNNDKKLSKKFLSLLPFSLTNAQQRVFQEIVFDLQQAKPMLRLVQGDVGSGKTVVALLAALVAIENTFQVALMAPTELLAEQHTQNFATWLAPLNLKTLCVTSKLKGKAREKTLSEITNGEIHLVVGTHALFQEDVQFANLALVIIDEQHRFGVHQRLALREKGIKNNYYPHQLIMTATPIPRTLAMTAYADLDCSIIDELPPGRTPIITIAVSNQRRHEIIQRVKENCLAAKQVYWVCTLIEESELLQCQAAENSHQQLSLALPEVRIGLIHGRLKSSEKEQVMAAFKNKEIDVLVATTVIEVGVDVPNASLMVIENPERLGLAQLHQLRGRVGRGALQSHCVLLYQTPLSLQAKERLKIMRESHDGFVIAQKDLELRGPGEVLGIKQTGLMQLKIADLMRDQHLLEEVQNAANLIMQQYPERIDLLISRWLKGGEKYGNV